MVEILLSKARLLEILLVAVVQRAAMVVKLAPRLNLVVVVVVLGHILMALLHHLQEAVRYLGRQEAEAAGQRHQPQVLPGARGVAMSLAAVEPLVQVALARAMAVMGHPVILAVVTVVAAEDITEPVEMVASQEAGGVPGAGGGGGGGGNTGGAGGNGARGEVRIWAW